MIAWNIGLNRNDNGGTIAPHRLIETLTRLGVEPQGLSIKQSATEPTAVFRTLEKPRDSVVWLACELLHQDCIAIRDDETGEGRLIGPKAEDWGPFNPDYFIAPSN